MRHDRRSGQAWCSVNKQPISKWIRNWAPAFAALPPLAVLGLCSAVWARAAWMRDSTEARYRTLAKRALEAQDYEQAKLCYARIIDAARSTTPQDQFQWALILTQSGDLSAAMAVIDDLAPDDGRGLPEAHRFKAVQMAIQLKQSTPQNISGANKDQFLQRFKHHIDRSGNADSIDMTDLRAAYYVLAGKPEEALKLLVETARMDPDLWLRAAAAAKIQGNQQTFTDALTRAETYYRERLQENPLDFQTRIAYSMVLKEQNQLDDAWRVLSEGLTLSDRVELRRAASTLILFRMEQIQAPWGDGFPEFSRLLWRALELDPINPSAYRVLVDAYHRTENTEQRAALRARLEQHIVQGDGVAFAHFALGTMLWSEGENETARWHTEQAFALNPNLLDVANNLAWMISESEPQELERAYELIQRVVQQRPEIIQFRDTKGVILMKMNRFAEALVEFETILPKLTGTARKQVHDRLASIYDALGKQSLAELHREQAGRL